MPNSIVELLSCIYARLTTQRTNSFESRTTLYLRELQFRPRLRKCPCRCQRIPTECASGLTCAPSHQNDTGDVRPHQVVFPAVPSDPQFTTILAAFQQ